ncbi:mediator of RNA polymerase II transcription subunit 8 isoform X1 [Tanacetum coccineum]
MSLRNLIWFYVLIQLDDDDAGDDNIEEKVFPPLAYSYACGYRHMKRNSLRLPPDQRQLIPALPVHLVDVLPVGDNVQTISESYVMYVKNTPPMVTNFVDNEGALIQGSRSQLMGQAAALPGETRTSSFDNTPASPLPYANSSRSATNMMNTPSLQQQQQQAH